MGQHLEKDSKSYDLINSFFEIDRDFDLTTCQVVCFAEDGIAVPFVMATTSAWLSLTDLAQIYGISSTHCERALQQEGLRDRYGRPTPSALQAGAACKHGPHKPPRAALWNAEVCKALLERTGYQPISRTKQIEQWAKFLAALEEGSPSINATPEQMVEDLPEELAGEVNDKLAEHGCQFRIPKAATSCRL